MIKATYINHMGNDLSVVNAARVSFGKESNSMTDGDAKLIKYLAEHGHNSPFGHCFATFHVKAPIFVARQLVKHKFLRWNEISRRYVSTEPEFYVPDQWRGQSKDKKQGSEGVVDLTQFTAMGVPISDDCDYDSMLTLDDLISVSDKDQVFNYQRLLEAGVCEEQARMVLPASLMTEWYWSGSMDAFADMYNLRSKEDTQYESQLVANQIGTKMKRLYPLSWKELTA